MMDAQLEIIIQAAKAALRSDEYNFLIEELNRVFPSEVPPSFYEAKAVELEKPQPINPADPKSRVAD